MTEQLPSTLANLKPEALAALLEREHSDRVLLAIDVWTQKHETDLAALGSLDALLEHTARQARTDRDAHDRLANYGARYSALHRIERRAGLIRVNLWRRIGRFVDSLPEDAGGRLGEGEAEPPRRAAKRQLGLNGDDFAGLVQLGRVDDEAFGELTAAIDSGAPIPKGPRAAARAVTRTVYGSGECYTHPRLIRPARVALGLGEGERFGEDPSTSWAPQTVNVQASRWRCLGEPEWGAREDAWSKTFEVSRERFDDELDLRLAEDGLGDTPWLPRWWLNPDYAAEVVEAFAKRAEAEADAGRPGVMLVNAASSSVWQQGLLARWPRCWVAGRQSFYNAHAQLMTGNQWPNVIFGVGIERAAFAAAYAEIGQCGGPL